ncbi:CxC ATPase DNA modification system associated small protein [Chloroflexota bacterium]
MSLDYIVYEAVKNAVEEAGQSESLAEKIIAWIVAISSGNEHLDDADNAYRRSKLLYDDTEVAEDSEEE